MSSRNNEVFRLVVISLQNKDKQWIFIISTRHNEKKGFRYVDPLCIVIAGRHNENPPFIVMAGQHNEKAKRQNYTSLFRLDITTTRCLSLFRSDITTKRKRRNTSLFRLDITATRYFSLFRSDITKWQKSATTLTCYLLKNSFYVLLWALK